MSERPDLAGRLVAGVHRLDVRVYYEDTDFSGVVYHANYLRFCERGRSDYLRLLGVQHHGGQGRRGFVVRHMTCDFLKPAVIDDVLCVETRLEAVRGARVMLAQQVLRQETALFTAMVTVALVNAQGVPQRVPADFFTTQARLNP